MRERNTTRAFAIGAVLAGALSCAGSAAAQTSTNAKGVSFTATLLASVQPPAFSGSSSPYLNEGLGGSGPGVALGRGVALFHRAGLTMELTIPSVLEAAQDGRFVVGGGPVDARHQDILVSILPGYRAPVGHLHVDLKGGVSVLVGTPERETYEYGDPAGTWAPTGGFDLVLPAGRHIAWVPAMRYSWAKRGEDALYFGLGRHIFTVGLGIRFGRAS